MDIRCPPNTLYILSSSALHIGKTIDILLSQMGITRLSLQYKVLLIIYKKIFFMLQNIKIEIVANFSIAKGPTNGQAFFF